MKKLEVFDPAMCCSTGICGDSDDPTLVNFASDLEWLKAQGVQVLRYGLSFDKADFVKNEAVKCALKCEGNACLPIIYVNDKIVSKSCYPSRQKLAEFCEIEYNNDEAPPIHREENCCCGLDCDCAHIQQEASKDYKPEYDCSSAAAEDNCHCAPPCNCDLIPKKKNLKKLVLIAFAVLFFAVMALIISDKSHHTNVTPAPPATQMPAN